ncbi:UNVERIFIED_CONTAM: hypothetical protein GTU68_000167, partial [Idotea baltica]|nr:hypothetical protein [Idotea baltica]
MPEQVKIAVLGAGSWGTALALALSRNQHKVTLWGHRESHCKAMKETGCNAQYLSGYIFPDNLQVESDLQKIVSEHKHYLLVPPSHAFRATLKRLKQCNIEDDSLIIWATKGFDKDGPVLLSDVVTQELGEKVKKAIVSGPSFSKEVAGDLPTAITAAGDSEAISSEVAALFLSGHMRVYTNPDFIGVQVGGAIKNVMAI